MNKKILATLAAAVTATSVVYADAQPDASPNALSIFSPYNTVSNYTRTLNTRMSQLRFDGADGFNSGETPWAIYTQNNYVYNKQDAQDQTFGYIEHNITSMAGIDRFLTENIAIGINTAYSYSELQFFDTPHPNGSVDALLFGVYGGYFTDTWFSTATMTAAHSNIDLRRNVNDTNLDSDHVAKTFGTSASLGYQFYAGDWIIAPEFGINYIRTNDDGYNEEGPANLVNHYEKRIYEALTSDLTVRATSEFPINTWSINPNLMFGWRHDFYDTEYLEAKRINTGNEFTIITPEQGENALLVEIGATATNNKNLSIMTGFRVELHEYYQTFGLLTQLRYNF
ncbi:autotransporter outer membrane beta-barrel domain-containing protein [Planctomycetota bacterium]|nr:autotransporter outer membrane beta-barrel domain-containing protein [Planctomycetota bacterium]